MSTDNSPTQFAGKCITCTPVLASVTVQEDAKPSFLFGTQKCFSISEAQTVQSLKLQLALNLLPVRQLLLINCDFCCFTPQMSQHYGTTQVPFFLPCISFIAEEIAARKLVLAVEVSAFIDQSYCLQHCKAARVFIMSALDAQRPFWHR